MMDWDWNSANQLIKKKIIRNGMFSKKPTEQCACKININNFQVTGLSISQFKEIWHYDFVDNISKIVINGDASSAIERYIEEVIQTMSINEHSFVTLQIGGKGLEKSNVECSFEITLESIEFYKPIWKWTLEEKYEAALKHKKKGVELFKLKRYIDAFYKFSKACKFLITLVPVDEDDEMFSKIYELKYVLYNNMAECQLKNKNYDHTVTLCSKVLSKEQSNIKALYRRGVAYGSLKDYERAVNDLKTVISLQPKDKNVQDKFNMYNEQWQISVRGYENIVRKMFVT